MLTEPLPILGVLCLNIALAEWLCRRTALKHLGTALLVIVLTAVVANAGLIPTSAEQAPVYFWLLGDVVNLAVFWILLQVNLKDLLRAGGPMIGMFLVGSAGTFIGVIVAMLAIDGARIFGQDSIGLSAMFAATYTGGSINFNAMAAEYKVSEKGALFAGSVVVDNIMTTIWMVVTIAVPRGIGFLQGWKTRLPKTAGTIDDVQHDTESLHPVDVALLIALGAAAIGISNLLAGWGEQYQVRIPAMLYLTVLALALAQTPLAARLRGARLLGLFSVYLFLAVIGALCDLAALANLQAGLSLLAFVAILVGLHGLITFGLGALFRVDRDVVAVASQANIGGSASAMAIARSLQRQDLVLPGILVGSLGTALGNFLGILAATVMSLIDGPPPPG